MGGVCCGDGHGFCRCGESIDRTLLKSLLRMFVDLQVERNFFFGFVIVLVDL